MREIPIGTEFIKLNQFLKFTNIAESGAAANHMIENGIVKVNGEIELQKRKKLYPGDSIEVNEIGKFVIPKEGSAEVALEGVDPKKL